LRHIDEIRLIEPVVAIAQKYQGVLPMAVGTGNTRKLTEMLLEVSGLKKYFTVVITADDVVHHKPHPETFLLCAQKMNVSPQLCQVFEDGQAGLLAARSGGMIATDVRPFVINWSAKN
jgi:beta-phosphoglucomutase-like phosphatase (HAD superfamily)